jgi:two-component sensor histidine kinase
VSPAGRSVACLLAREPLSPCRAREQTRSALDGWGLGEDADLAALIVSELVANAVCHGAGLIAVCLSVADGRMRAEVHDHGPARPVRKHADSDDESGRGLELLEGLTILHGGELGVIDDHDGPGKTVYVDICLPGLAGVL